MTTFKCTNDTIKQYLSVIYKHNDSRKSRSSNDYDCVSRVPLWLCVKALQLKLKITVL